MQALRQFSIPIKGLDVKVHQFTFQVDDQFFSHFEYSPYKKGQITSELELEKKYDNLVLTFNNKGNLRTVCGRWIAEIDFPVEVSFELIVKYDENE